MDEVKAAPTSSPGDDGQTPPLSTKETGQNHEISSSTSERHRPSEDDIENQNHIEPQRSNGSVWASESMSLLQEVLFVATVCLTQFCNREHSLLDTPAIILFLALKSFADSQ